MPDQPNHSLAEISHLFLSAVRDKATGNNPRPQRTPPQAQTPGQSAAVSRIPPAISIDLTPEEFAQMNGEVGDEAAEPRGAIQIPRVTAVLANHLNSRQFDRVKDYARHLAGQGTCVGLIEIDASEFRVSCYDRRSGDSPIDATPAESFDPRQMNEVLEELSWDVQRWLLVLPSARVPEARQLLRDTNHWLLLSTVDHDGVIACYRTLKGLTDLWPAERADCKPKLSLALLDATDEAHAEKVSTKLVSVCQQFLNWPLETEAAVRGSQDVAEHLVLSCRPLHDKGQIASAPHWDILSNFIARSKQQPQQPTAGQSEAPARAVPSQEAPTMKPIMRSIPMHPQLQSQVESDDAQDVIDLPADTSDTTDAILSAILANANGNLIECPITPPMCPRARLAVTRDRRLTMLAVARQGLADLHSIGLAYQWLQQNHALIAMAVPQLAINANQPPHLSLLINQSDSTAQTIQPMLQGENVTVQTYRKLRWGGKTGLLLEAA